MNQIRPAAPRGSKSKIGEPVWELARLFPSQGEWTEESYLALDTGQLIEYSDGFLEVLPMPTLAHQRIVKFLFAILHVFLENHGIGGEVLFAPLPVKVDRRKFREPDIVYLSAERRETAPANYPEGADLIIEVVSGGPSDRTRDYIDKRHDYAMAGIPEYWIVDPQEEVIVVLQLDGEEYIEHGRFTDRDTATSVLLPGFSVPVVDVWAVAK